MKIKESFVLRDVCGEKVLVSEGIENIDYSKIVHLNETAAYLWENLQGTEFEVEDMVALLIKEYDVLEDVAMSDSKQLVQKWQDAALIV